MQTSDLQNAMEEMLRNFISLGNIIALHPEQLSEVRKDFEILRLEIFITVKQANLAAMAISDTLMHISTIADQAKNLLSS